MSADAQEHRGKMQTLCELWLAAKETERVAVEERRKIEDRLSSLIGIAETLEGTETATPDGFVIKVVGRMNRKVDADKAQEIAAEHGIEAHLSTIFRWKPEIDARAWKAAPDSVTTPLLAAITTTPSRPSYTIARKE
jgi:hypothetical protein